MARNKWDRTRYDPTTETFSDFLNSLKNNVKQAFRTKAERRKRLFSFGKLPDEIQQVLTPEEMKTYLMRSYQYQQMITSPTTIQLFNKATPSATITKATLQLTQTEHENFERQCFYCGKIEHSKTEWRTKERNEASRIH